MIYFNDSDFENVTLNWNELLNLIKDSSEILEDGDFSQPVKPYLRFKDLSNRIIAMPGYIGGKHETAGIKWIASFPSNNKLGLKRANSVTILNDTDTGVPYAIFNTSVVSSVRTAAVSGSVVQKYLEDREDLSQMNITIIGMGPIGLMHLAMLRELYEDRIKNIFVYDLNENLLKELVNLNIPNNKITVLNSWDESISSSDIFITCTVSSNRYIDKSPKKGSLHLNVSLRDYKLEFFNYVDVIVVDSWEEVNRENTDIENMHIHKSLHKEDTLNIYEYLFHESLKGDNKTIMFNPMGMAIYDLSISRYLFHVFQTQNIGQRL